MFWFLKWIAIANFTESGFFRSLIFDKTSTNLLYVSIVVSRLPSLAYYSLFWWVIQLPEQSYVVIGGVMIVLISICFDLLIKKAFHLKYRTVIRFYKNNKWLTMRLILTAIAYGLIIFIFVTLPPPMLASS